MIRERFITAWMKSNTNVSQTRSRAVVLQRLVHHVTKQKLTAGAQFVCLFYLKEIYPHIKVSQCSLSFKKKNTSQLSALIFNYSGVFLLHFSCLQVPEKHEQPQRESLHTHTPPEESVEMVSDGLLPAVVGSVRLDAAALRTLVHHLSWFELQAFDEFFGCVPFGHSSLSNET